MADSERILWNASIAKSPPTVTYNSVMGDEKGNVDEESAERGMKKLLEKVVSPYAIALSFTPVSSSHCSSRLGVPQHDFGFCFITSVPPTPEETEKVIRRIGHIRETHYGGFWDFTADLKMGDMAYTNEGLPAHTDNTYFVGFRVHRKVVSARWID